MNSRHAIISDLHANLEATETVLAKIDEIGVDQIICLGDVVGYNGSPNECVDIIRERQIPTICGNHDAVACGREEPWGFNPVALHAVIWTRETLRDDNLQWLTELPDESKFDSCLVVHGSPTDRNRYMFLWEDVLPHMAYVQKRDCNVCFFGHTHNPGVLSNDGVHELGNNSEFVLDGGKIFFVNPGSVGQPRDSDPRASFGIFDTASSVFELMRLSYPVERAADRVAELGLPDFLSERLFLGR